MIIFVRTLPILWIALNFVISDRAKYKMNLHCESSYLVTSSFLSTVIDGKILNTINYSFDITVDDISFWVESSFQILFEISISFEKFKLWT